MSNDNAVFLKGDLLKHVSVMSFTASIGLMAMFAVDFIDMIFISMLGNDALAAAVGYAGALLFFTNSINIGLSIAAGSMVAQAIGADEKDKAREHATSVAMIGVFIGILVPLLVLFNLRFLLQLLGAKGETLELAVSYIQIILPTMPLMAVAIAGMAVLRAHGDAKRSMFSTLYGGTANAILDPILIFGLSLGLEGAAIASVCARIVMLVTALYGAIKIHDGFAVPSLDLLKRDISAVSKIAGPAVLTNFATPVGTAIVTREIAKFGDDAVSAYAVIGRLTPVAFAVVFALSGAIGPIIGQNFGAQKYKRVHKAFDAGILFVFVYVLVVSAILYLLRKPIADIFDAQDLTLTLIYLFCGPLALLSFFNGVIFVANASFNNLGHPIYSTWINWGRNTLGIWPLVIIGSSWYGAAGVLVGQALGGVIFAAIAYFVANRTFVNLEGTKPLEPFTPHRRLHTLFGRGRW